MNKRTQAVSIPQNVKKAVAKRDSIDGWCCCVYCGTPAPTTNPLAFSNAHFIPRSDNGRGIEENILSLCWYCHMRYDQTEHREYMREFFKDYLKFKYVDWDEEKLIYKKEF